MTARRPKLPAETMSLEEAAQRAGFGISTFREHQKAGTLPFPVLTVGRTTRVPTVPFDRWLAGLPPLVEVAPGEYIGQLAPRAKFEAAS